jgi:hypothetical protein
VEEQESDRAGEQQRADGFTVDEGAKTGRHRRALERRSRHRGL